MTPSRVCETCEDTGLTGMSFVVMAIIILVLVLVGFVVSKYWPQMPGKHLVRCAFVPVRIMVTYAQVVSQLGEVLSFPYPPLFNSVVNVIRPIIDVWGVLFRLLGLSSECAGLIGFNSRWTMRVVVLPLVLLVIIGIIYAVEKCKREDSSKAGSHARGNMFLAVFFVYPGICAVAFQAFMCKPLSGDYSMVEADDTTLCEDDGHKPIQILSAIVIALFAVGLPAALLVTLMRKENAYKQSKDKELNAELAARVATTLDVNKYQAEMVIRDITIGQDYSWLAAAPQRSCWRLCSWRSCSSRSRSRAAHTATRRTICCVL
jgi:hypothetical protein